MPIMQLTRPRMVQLLNILQLPTPLLELAEPLPPARARAARNLGAAA